MPAKPSWFLKLPAIRAQLEELVLPVVDRACFEQIFSVSRRRAIQLMHRFGGFQAGRTFLIDRTSLLLSLRRLEKSGEYEWERARKNRLVQELEFTRKSMSGRQVKLMVPSDVRDTRLADLPAGICLEPGQLRIDFHGTEDLLRQLFELSQAIVNDYNRFEQICEQK